MTAPIAPPFCPPAGALRALAEAGYAVLAPQELLRVAGCAAGDFDGLIPAWDRLELDHHLRDGGHYRQRRHSCFRVKGDRAEPVPHRAHWQSEDYNALHGGIERWFEPLEDDFSRSGAFERLLVGLGSVFGALLPGDIWHVEAHAFRIDTTGGIGRPTPEGAHRDGVDFVAVVLIARVDIKGGETRVFEAHGPAGQRFTLTEPWSALVLDDSRVVHETTPIQPIDDAGHRDTLVLTYRRDGFQEPPAGI